MGRPYSMDLREQVVAATEGGMSTRQAAARFSIGIATAGVWARQHWKPPSQAPSANSNRTIVQTSSPTPDMAWIKRNPL
jgi:transposase